jgi:Holliday junction resolvase
MENLTHSNDNLNFEKVWLMFEETDKRMKETDKQMRETDKKLRQLESLFVGHWGKLVESLVRGDLVNLLQKKGIKVERTSQRESAFYDGREFEFDIIAKNGTEIVVVEVKTTLKVNAVKKFIEELRVFKNAMPEYANKKLYGAVAYLNVEEEAEKYAEKKGFIVIRATGSSASIINKDAFKPVIWGE